jgi:hypothetical protein
VVTNANAPVPDLEEGFNAGDTAAGALASAGGATIIADRSPVKRS